MREVAEAAMRASVAREEAQRRALRRGPRRYRTERDRAHAGDSRRLSFGHRGAGRADPQDRSAQGSRGSVQGRLRRAAGRRQPRSTGPRPMRSRFSPARRAMRRRSTRSTRSTSWPRKSPGGGCITKPWSACCARPTRPIVEGAGVTPYLPLPELRKRRCSSLPPRRRASDGSALGNPQGVADRRCGRWSAALLSSLIVVPETAAGGDHPHRRAGARGQPFKPDQPFGRPARASGAASRCSTG